MADKEIVQLVAAAVEVEIFVEVDAVVNVEIVHQLRQKIVMAVVFDLELQSNHLYQQR
jgi:hypothetical protein